jgi:protein-tyrosine phosphatase
MPEAMHVRPKGLSISVLAVELAKEDGKGGWNSHIEMEGCLNFRDLGGYATADGREVRTGCLYRSAELCSLTPRDLAILRELNISVVVDLRNDPERQARPSSGLPDGIEVVARPRAASGDPRTLEDQIAAGEVPVKDDDYVVRSYCETLTHLAPDFGLVLQRAVSAREAPILFHCSAGKDRTGLAAAVLLGVLGVPDEAILFDYELTSQYYAPRRLEALNDLLRAQALTVEDVRHLVEARPIGMIAALNVVRDRWGGFDAYAVDCAGCPPDLPDRLRAVLLSSKEGVVPRSRTTGDA